MLRWKFHAVRGFSMVQRDTLNTSSHPEIQMIQYLRWSGISIFENTVGLSKWMCEDCVRYKKLHEDVSDWTDSLAFTPLCSRAETEDFENDWTLQDSSSGSPFLQNTANVVVNRIMGEFTRVAENQFSRSFFDLRHAGLLKPYLFPSIY